MYQYHRSAIYQDITNLLQILMYDSTDGRCMGVQSAAEKKNKLVNARLKCSLFGFLLRSPSKCRFLEHNIFPGRDDLLFMDPAVVSCMIHQCEGTTAQHGTVGPSIGTK